MSLRRTLSLVDKLEKDLSAEIVHQEEITRGVYEEERHLDWYRSICIGSEVVKQRIAEPDHKKRENAKKKLQELYDSSKYYSVKCKAGFALNFSKGNLDGKINSWILELAHNHNNRNKHRNKLDLKSLFLVLGNNSPNKLNSFYINRTRPFRARMLAYKAEKKTEYKPEKRKDTDTISIGCAIGCLSIIIGSAGLVCYGIYKYLNI